MFLGYQGILEKKKIFLCSQSKPRRHLLEQLGLTFNIYPSSFEENLDKSLFNDPKDYVRETCNGKVKDVMNKFKSENVDWDIAIFCDTIIVLNGKIVEKPESSEEAAEFLREFKNKEQEVHTACFVVFNDKINNNFIEKSIIDTCKVIFGDIPEQSILAYSLSNHWKGKCGGYGIQDIGASFVQRTEGEYSTVIGLPVYQFSKIIVDTIQQLQWN